MPNAVTSRRLRADAGIRAVARALLAIAALAVISSSAHAQIGAIRRAREAVRDRLPSLASLFGDTPAITTNIEDGKDGVALLDDFNPEAYSPMREMPRGPDGSVLLSPGSFVMMVESFCLHPGTFGPHLGEGYLHTDWKGPRADVVMNVLRRYPDHPEVTQQQAQQLLWAIISRTKFETLRAEVKLAASRLLTPAELANLAGYGLDAVENGLRDRVLASLPAPARRVYEAENELRRLLARADAEYAEMERTAVREGRMPLEESIFTLPDTRWSYHPNGFFIRYQPRTYKLMRIDAYVPERIQIGRDASGRIISIKAPDGRQLEPEYSAGATPVGGTFSSAPWTFDDPGATAAAFHMASVRYSAPALRATRARVASIAHAGTRTGTRAVPSAGTFGAAASRVELLSAAARHTSADSRAAMLALARADLADLRAIEAAMRSAARLPAGRDAAQAQALIRSAVHAALARHLGLSRLARLPGASPLADALRPVRGLSGYTYVVAPVGTDVSELAQGYRPMRPFPPNRGGASGAGSRQRLGPTMGQSSAPSNTPGPNPPDALDKAQQITSWFGAAMDALGALTNPAGILGGQMNSQMMNAGMEANYNTARQISNSLGGGDDDDHDAHHHANHAGASSIPAPAANVFQPTGDIAAVRPARSRTDTELSLGLSPAPFTPVSWSPMPAARAVTRAPAPRQGGTSDYRTVVTPRTIQFPPVAPGAITPAHANAVNALMASTFRVGMALEAVLLTVPRLQAAVAAQDLEWQDAQGQALVRLKRQAGVELVQLSRDIDALLAIVRPDQFPTEAEARQAQQQLSGTGWTPAALAVYRQIGRTDAEIEQARQRLLAADAAANARSLPETLRQLSAAARAYGAYLMLLPELLVSG